jgi:hypothetical protein
VEFGKSERYPNANTQLATGLYSQGKVGGAAGGRQYEWSAMKFLSGEILIYCLQSVFWVEGQSSGCLAWEKILVHLENQYLTSQGTDVDVVFWTFPLSPVFRI